MALGAYDITPFEAVGGYTMFANGGRYVKPDFLELVRDQTGRELYRHKEQSKQVLDPRVAYIVTSMMEDVLLHGTAAGARAESGFAAPAAGKTGTSQLGMAGSRGTPPSYCAWCGWGSTTTSIWGSKARGRRRPSGCSS